MKKNNSSILIFCIFIATVIFIFGCGCNGQTSFADSHQKNDLSKNKNQNIPDDTKSSDIRLSNKSGSDYREVEYYYSPLTYEKFLAIYNSTDEFTLLAISYKSNENFDQNGVSKH